MNRALKLACLKIAVFAISHEKTRAHTGVGEVIVVAEFINWAWGEGKKWQASQSWGRFKSAGPSVPLYVGNFTNMTVEFSSETASCERSRHAFKAFETDVISCPNARGDNFHNIYFKDQAFAVSGPSAIIFKYGSAPGSIEVQEVDISQAAAPPRPQQTAPMDRSGRGARGGVSPSMQPCTNSGPFTGAPRMGDPVGCR